MPRRAESTQHIVNSFPPWASTRTDEQSVGYQFLNIIGARHDDLHKQLRTIGDNYHLAIANLSDLDIVRRVELGESFGFGIERDEDGIEVPQAPVVSGLITIDGVGDVYQAVSIADRNTIENFWDNAVPDRLTFEITYSGSHLVMSGDVIDSPMPSSGSVYVESGAYFFTEHLDENILWVRLEGAENLIDIRDGIPVRGTIRLQGISRGQEDEEYLIFLHDQVKPTFKEWERVTNVEVYNVDPPTTRLSITCGRFADGPYRDFYDLERNPESDEHKEVFWDVANITVGSTIIPVLRKWRYIQEEVASRLDGFIQQDTEQSVELRDVDGSALDIPVVDMAIQPFSDRIWVLASLSPPGGPVITNPDTGLPVLPLFPNRLFLYDKYLNIASTSGLTKRTPNSSIRIDPSSLHLIRGQSVELSYFWARPTKRLIRHRVYVDRPSGTRNLIVSGALVAWDASSWVVGEPTGRIIRAPEEIALTLPGDYTFTLEVQFSDGSRETDQQIVSVDQKNALASFDAYNIRPTGGALAGVDVDSKHRIWLWSSTFGEFYRVAPRYDTMLIDYLGKVIYFRENYLHVKVIP